MKRLLILLLLLPSLAWGGETQIARMNPYILGGGAAAADYCAGTTLFCSTFEAATEWTATNGTSDCDGYDTDGDYCDGDTTTPLIGLKSFGLRGNTVYYGRKNLSSLDQGEFYIEVWLRLDDADVGTPIAVRTSIGQDIVRINAGTAANLTIKVNDGSVALACDPAYTLSSDTTYHIGIYFKVETGSDDGIVRVWANTSTTAGFSVTDLKISLTNVNTGAYLGDLVSVSGAGSGEIAYTDNLKIVAGSPSWTYE